MLNYDEPVFRPPSEANSLILQVTLGCSNNQCTFCEMYTGKKFSVRSMNDIEDDIKKAASFWPCPDKIFLADGDALVIRASKLEHICGLIHEKFEGVPRISAYATPNNILVKSDEDLKSIRKSGISLIYIGVESGNDTVLKKVCKGSTSDEIGEAILRAGRAGFETSVTWILGLGGKKYSHDHATDTAKLLSKCSPTYTSALTLMLPCGETRLKKNFPEWEEISPVDSLTEIKIFAENYKGNSTIFRSNHASNYLPIKAVLPDDKNKLATIIDEVIKNPDGHLRPEWSRAL